MKPTNQLKHVRLQRRVVFLTLILLGVRAICFGSAIPPGRTTQWQGNVGVSGGIPNYTTIYQTLTPSNTLAQINAAIAACPQNQVVKLAPGTYNLSTVGQFPSRGIYFADKRNMVLRGSGNSTILNFTGGPYMGNIYVETTNMPWIPGTAPAHIADWTAGLAQGSTSITLSNVSGLSVGMYLWVDQKNDGNDVGVGHSYDGCSNCGREGGTRSQEQMLKVTGINGNVVSITPPIQMPNWRSTQIPQAWWVGALSGGVGIEDLRIIGSLSGPGAGWGANIQFTYSPNSWVQNVRSENEYRGFTYPISAATHVGIYQSGFTTVRHCSFYGTRSAASLSYGVLLFAGSNNLIEDNTFEKIAAPVVIGSSAGNVVAYNYMKNGYYQDPPSFLMQSIWTHDAHACMNLIEGNYGNGVRADAFHGTTGYITVFRNRFTGWEAATPPKSQNSMPVMIDTYNRYWNYAGNILGTTGVQPDYESLAGGTFHGTAIWYVGWSAAHPNPPHDPVSATSMYRHGNYDTVTNGITWDASNADHNLPSSYYLPSKPAWFGNLAFPPIHPGPPNSVTASSIPAGYRFVNGVDPPGGTPVPTPTATATSTSTPSPTPTATATATPTGTPLPTPTPIPLGTSFASTAGVITNPFVINTNTNTISQSVQTVDPTQGGRALYTFSVPTSGDYLLSTMMNCSDGGSNSVFVNIDAEPSPEMMWDIPVTLVPQIRIASWSPSTIPKVWTLSAGTHQLIIRGREANTILGQITLGIAPHAPTGLRVVP